LKVQGEDQGSSAEGWESLGEGLMEAERLWRLLSPGHQVDEAGNPPEVSRRFGRQEGR